MFYRLKHLPTGLYFCPSRELKISLLDADQGRTITGYVKSNLSFSGKVYTRRPSLKFLGEGFRSHLHIQWKKTGFYPHAKTAFAPILPVNPVEWEIEETD